jgi:CHAD domain-containing protein
MPVSTKIAWDPLIGPEANARRFLPPLVGAYFAEGRSLILEATEPAQLHRLRLLSKRLRYTLELFRPLYGPGLEERLEALKRMQDVLGDTNDAVASARLIEYLPRSVRMKRYLAGLAAKNAEAVRAEWTERFDASGREMWWTGYLATGTRQTAKPAPES